MTLALDIMVTPWRSFRLGQIGRRHLAYDEGSLSAEVRDYFNDADALTLFRLGAGLAYSLRRGVSTSVGIVRQTSNSTSRPPRDGEIWPQKDITINARLRIRVY